MMDNWVKIGKIVGAHGLVGQVKVSSRVENVALLEDGPIRLVGKGADKAKDWKVTSVKPGTKGNTLLVGLDGVTNRNMAEALIGRVLEIPRERLPEAEAGSFYWHDLIGLEVRGVDGVVYGTIRRIMETGAHDVFEVTGGPRELLIPGHPDMVEEVNLQDGYILMRLPDGMAEV